MTRDIKKSKVYFDDCIEFIQHEAVNPRKDRLPQLTRQEGRAGCASDLWSYSVKLTIHRYGRGDSIDAISPSVHQMIDLLTLRESTIRTAELAKDVRQMYERLDLSKLYEFLTLLAFQVSLRFSNKNILDVMELFGHFGEDSMIDNVGNQVGRSAREITTVSKFPKIYDDLAKIFAMHPQGRSESLKNYVTSWYRRMKPISWHGNHEAAEGAYFGYWCFEGALVAMLLHIDDSELIDHPNYPYDLVKHYREATN